MDKHNYIRLILSEKSGILLPTFSLSAVPMFAQFSSKNSQKYNKISFMKVFYRFFRSIMPMAALMGICCSAFDAQAQIVTPGNTPYTVEYWLRADDLSASNDAQITQWVDVNGKVFTGTTGTAAGTAPKMKIQSANYNPAVNFSTVTRRMLSVNNFNTDAGRAYLTFYVSRTDLTSATAQGAMFAYRANFDEGWVGTGLTGNNLYYYNGTASTFAVSLGLAKESGIVGFERNTGATLAQAHHNAKPIIHGTANSARNVATGSGKAILGARAETGTTNAFNGDIQEIIVLSTPTSVPFNQGQIQKIQSYLAIKYGQTLDISQPNLYNSLGTVVWSAAADNRFNNHVFGIARDNGTKLYQKQSANVDDPSLTVFLGNDIQMLNSQNAVAMNDMTYLLLGSNAQTGVVPYVHSKGTTFENSFILTDEAFSRRQNRLYRVQLTGTDSVNVSMKVSNIKAKYIIVSNNENFLSASTKVYPLNDNMIANNIVIKNGDFVGFVLSSATPGGVTCDIEFWLKADQIQNNGVLPNNSLIERWENKSEKVNDFIQNTATRKPLYAYDGMNFQPAVRFPTYTAASGIRMMESEYNFVKEGSANRIYLSFYVTKTGTLLYSNSTNGAIFAYAPSVDEGWYGQTSVVYAYYSNITANPGFGVRREGILSINRANSISHNAKRLSTSPSLITAATSKALLGARLASPAVATSFTGDIQEVIILSTTSGSFSASEIQRVNSYLAIKYGQVLDMNSQPNFYNSEDQIVWDGTTSKNTGYNNHMFGVARDNGSGLYQKQSMCMDDTINTLTAFLGGSLYTLSEQNGGTLDDMTYLIFGSNTQTGSMNFTCDNGSEFINYTLNDEFITKRQNRIYKTQLSGTDSVTLSFKISKFKANYIMVSSSPAFTPANTRIYPINNSGIAFNVLVKDQEYIGFALTQRLPGGGGNYTVEFWLKAEQIQNGEYLSENTSVALWENQSEKMNNFVQTNTMYRPQYVYDGMNYHPAVRFPTYAAATGIKSMESEFDFTKDGSRSYLSFYVSKAGALYSTTTNGAIFAYAANVDEGWYGNNAASDYAYYYSGTNRLFNPGLGKRYGILSMNRTGSISHNAKVASGTAAAIPSSTSKAFLGKRLATGALASSFIGDIQEVIILSAAGTFSASDIRRINSYLAIKYGQSLDTIAQPNLYSAKDSIVWSGQLNTGYNRNVFGIAREEITGLYQKQSCNVDDDAITLFLGNVLQTLNEQNIKKMNNETYLLLGSNGKNGQVSYPLPGTTIFENASLALTNSVRQERVYKTQLSGETQLTASIKLNKFAAEYVIVSASPTFLPTTSTRIYPIEDGIAHDVMLATGEFIGFILSNELPGGVNAYNLELWLKADQVRPGEQLPENAQVKTWANLSGSILGFAQYESEAVPTYKTNSLNYQPGVNFATILGTGSTANVRINGNKLVSETEIQTDGGRLYRTFHVSAYNPQVATTTARYYGSVFAYRTNFDEGWMQKSTNTTLDPSYAYFTDNNLFTEASYTWVNPAFDVVNNPRYGIISTDRNNGTIWHNAKSAVGTIRNITTGTGRAIIGSGLQTRVNSTGVNTDNNNYFDGNIQEIIVISTPNNIPFDAGQIAKINTYLAVKYGQMLDTNGHPVWLRSDSVKVWDIANHRGFNRNIFGIGRDDASGLYQKQSLSVGSSERITAFIGNDIKPSQNNSKNGGTLADGFFMLFGSNGQATTAQKPYGYGIGVPFLNETFDDTVQYRTATILKANITGAASFNINLYMGGVKADYVLVSADTNFVPSATRIHKVDANSVASNVLINQGEYISFAYFQVFPAGISDSLVMWLRADEPSSAILDPKTGKMNEWHDFSGNPNDIYYYYKPVYTSGGFDYESRASRPGFRAIDPDLNFHPAVTFEKNTLTSGTGNALDRDYLVTDKAPFSKANPDYYTIITVFRIKDIGGYGNPDGYASHYFAYGGHTTNPDTRYPIMGFNKANDGRNIARVYREGSGGAYMSPLGMFTEGAATIAMFANNNMTSPYQLYFEADGFVQTVNSSKANSQKMNQQGTLGCGSYQQRGLIGSMAEMIAFEGLLSTNDKQKLYSNLALKYGMTLDLDKTSSAIAYNYILSDGTVVWAGNSDPLYNRFHNNIAAIVREKATGLSNLQSHSTDVGSSILMGIGTRLGTNPILTGLENDKEIIIWGHNGEPFVTAAYPPTNVPMADTCGNFTEMLTGRMWMVDVNTQQNYTVLIGVGDQGFPSTDPTLNFPYTAGYEVTLLIADDSNKIKSMQWDFAIPGVWSEGLHQFSLPLEAGKKYYFTFGGRQVSGSCPTCDVLNRFKNITFNTAVWKNGWNTADFKLNDRGFNANVRVEFMGTGARFVSGYPRAYSNFLRIHRTSSVQPTMRIVIDLDTAALASFEVGKIDYSRGRYTNVKVYGICGAGNVVPTLSYATTKANSFYTIYSGGRAVASKPRNASVTNRNAWMQVDFENPVQQIVIEQTHSGNTSGTLEKHFMLGTLKFACPAPPKPVNEDGLSFTQQVMPQEVRLCEMVTYTWRIQNTNCSDKTGKFIAVLPDGMLWERNSLVIDDVHLAGATVQSYAGIRQLVIDSLFLTPNSTTTFRAVAYFDIAATAKTYSNTATFEYRQVVNNTPTTIYLSSCDHLSLGCEPTSVVALPAPGRLAPLEVLSFQLDKSCYSKNDIIQANLVIRNPNTVPILQAGMEIYYNENFRYVAGSLTGLAGMGLANVILDEDTGLPDGTLLISGTSGTGFAIPAGQHTITLRVTAPNALDPDYEYDFETNIEDKILLTENGDTLYQPFNIAFDFFTMAEEDECASSVFHNAYGDTMIQVKPEVYITGADTIFRRDTTTLSRWLGGTWVVDDPQVARLVQTDTATYAIGVAPGKTIFRFIPQDGICQAATDTLVVRAIPPFEIWNWEDLATFAAIINDPMSDGLRDAIVMQHIGIPKQPTTYGDGYGDGTNQSPYYNSTGNDSIKKYGWYGYEGHGGLEPAYNPATPQTGYGWHPTRGFDIPIGSQIGSYKYFKGTFDGQGFEITGLWFNTGIYLPARGLFGHADSAVIKNIGLVLHTTKGIICDASGGDDVQLGGLVGETRNTTITNCYVIGSVAGSGNNMYVVGGLVGETQNTTITNCYTEGTITNTNVTGRYSGTGGLAGRIRKSVVSNCYSTANVTVLNVSGIGGFVGQVINKSIIENCYATGNVIGQNNRDYGGFFGYAENSHIKKCYATGNVSGEYFTGGFGGYMTLTPPDSCTVYYSYATGTVKGISAVGGLIGGSEYGKIVGCFALNDTLQSTSAPIGRIIGMSTVCTLSNNYAANCMLVNGSRVYSSNAASLDGAGINTSSITQPNSAPYITNGWNFDSVWTFNYSYGSGLYNVDANTNLPILQAFSYAAFPSAVQVPEAGCPDTIPAVFEIWNWEDLGKYAGYINNPLSGGKVKGILMQDIGIPQQTATYGKGSATAKNGMKYSPHYSDLTADSIKKYGWFGYEGHGGLESAYNAAVTQTGYGWDNVEGFAVIGTTWGLRFVDTFNGQGFEIYGLWMNNNIARPYDWYTGLFGITNNAVIKNLGIVIHPNKSLTNNSIHPDAHTGGLVAQSMGNTQISNCYVIGDLREAIIDVGGLVGGAWGNTSITNCYTKGTVSTINPYCAVGGLVGEVSGSGVIISNSFSNSHVTGHHGIGGLVGALRGGTIRNCYATGDVIGGGSGASGGLIGYVDGTVINCYATGKVEGGGGLFGWVSSVSQTNCYAFNSDIIGGASRLLYEFQGPTIFNNNYAVNCMEIDGVRVTSSDNTSSNGADVSPSAIIQPNSSHYTTNGWDFTSTWTFNYTYGSGAYNVTSSTNLPILQVFNNTDFPNAVQVPRAGCLCDSVPLSTRDTNIVCNATTTVNLLDLASTTTGKVLEFSHVKDFATGISTHTAHAVNPSTSTVYVRALDTLSNCYSEVDSIVISVVAVPNPAPSVSLYATDTSVCSGVTITFTATPANTVGTPVYVWKNKGMTLGGIGTSFIYMPSNGDRITVEMRISNYCPADNPVSNAINIKVIPNVAPSIIIGVREN